MSMVENRPKRINIGNRILDSRKARVSHECYVCRSMIFPNEYYYEETLSGSGVASFVHSRALCEDCVSKEKNAES